MMGPTNYSHDAPFCARMAYYCRYVIHNKVRATLRHLVVDLARATLPLALTRVGVRAARFSPLGAAAG